MRIDQTAPVEEQVRQLGDLVNNRLTALDNWGGEGEEGQVLVSTGPDTPPQWESVEELVAGSVGASPFSDITVANVGDIIAANATNHFDRLPGNSASARRFLASKPVAGLPQMPAWLRVTAPDVDAGSFPTGTFTFPGNVVVGADPGGTDKLRVGGDAQFGTTTASNVEIRQGANVAVRVKSDSATSVPFISFGFGVDPVFAGGRSSGTIAAPALPLAGNTLVAFQGYGWDGGSFFHTGAIRMIAKTNWVAGTNRETFVVLSTTANGSITHTGRWGVTSAGHFQPMTIAGTDSDNLYNIGSATARVANIFSVLGTYSGLVTLSGGIALTGTITYANLPTGAGTWSTGGGDISFAQALLPSVDNSAGKVLGSASFRWFDIRAMTATYSTSVTTPLVTSAAGNLLLQSAGTTKLTVGASTVSLSNTVTVFSWPNAGGSVNSFIMGTAAFHIFTILRDTSVSGGTLYQCGGGTITVSNDGDQLRNFAVDGLAWSGGARTGVTYSGFEIGNWALGCNIGSASTAYGVKIDFTGFTATTKWAFHATNDLSLFKGIRASADNTEDIAATATRYRSIFAYTGDFKTQVKSPILDSGSAVDLTLKRNGATVLVIGASAITTGVWNGTKIAEGFGGTNQTTYTKGDILYASAANTLSKLVVAGASDGWALTYNSVSGVPEWRAIPAGGGGITGTNGAATYVAVWTSASNIDVKNGAATRVIGGTVSFSIRNNADSADNILVADAGGITFRAGLSGITTISMSSTLTMTAAASQIIPGATSWAVRNNANSANNLIITDAGFATFRADVSATRFNVLGAANGSRIGINDTFQTTATAPNTVVKGYTYTATQVISGGTFLEVSAFRVSPSSLLVSGSSHNAYGLWVESQTTASGAGQVFGIRVDDITAAASPSANYALYTSAGQVYHGDNITMGRAGLYTITTQRGDAHGSGVAVLDFLMQGRNSTSGLVNYGEIVGWCQTDTALAEYGNIRFNVLTNGASVIAMQAGDGIQIGSPTGGFKGVGTLNLDVALYVDGTKVVGARGASVTAPSGGTVQDGEARTAISDLISRLQAHGLIA